MEKNDSNETERQTFAFIQSVMRYAAGGLAFLLVYIHFVAGEGLTLPFNLPATFPPDRYELTFQGPVLLLGISILSGLAVQCGVLWIRNMSRRLSFLRWSAVLIFLLTAVAFLWAGRTILQNPERLRKDNAGATPSSVSP